MFLTPYVNKDNCVSNFGSKEWKVGLVEVKALINSTTQQREQQRYQLPSFGNRSRNIWRLYLLNLPYPFCQWLAAVAFVYSLATIEQAYKCFDVV